MAAPAIHRLEKERVGNFTRTYDPGSGETIYVDAPIWFKEDFHNTGVAATSATIVPFNVRDQSAAGSPTIALGTDKPGGVFAVTNDAQNEQQFGQLDYADNRILDVGKGLNIECRVKITAADATALEFAFGVISDHNIAIASIAAYGLFRLNNSFALFAEKDDASAVVTSSTLLTLLTGQNYVLRIDFTDLAVPRFFVNGTEYVPSTALDLSGLSAGNKILQPCVRCGKTTGTTLPAYEVDYVAFWQGR